MAFPANLSFRFDRKARLSMLAIAVCVTYIAAGFAVAAGFREASTRLGDTFSPELTVAEADRSFAQDGATLAYTVRGTVNGTLLTLAALEGADAYEVSPSTIFVQPAIGESDDVIVVVDAGDASLNLSTVLVPERAGWPRDWAYVSKETLQRLSPEDAKRPDVVFLPRGGTPAPAVQSFFLGTADEVAQDLWLIVAFASLVVALIAGEFIRLEIREKRRQIGIWRALGLSRRQTASVLLARAAGVAAVGTLLGWFTAILALTAIALASPSLAAVRDSVLVSLPIASAVVVLSAILGALLPVLRATNQQPARLLEAYV